MSNLLVMVDWTLKSRATQDGVDVDAFTGIRMLLAREKTPAEKGAWQLLREMTNAQRAEFMTLVDLARGHVKVGSAKERNARAVDQSWESDDAYLFEKFGNGYMRKALARYGLEWSPIGTTPISAPAA